MKTKMQRLAFAGKLEVKFADTGAETAEKTFAGYGAVFNNTDHANDIIAPGAFTATLAEHKAAGTAPAMFFNHDHYSMPIGVWTDLAEDEHGLKASGQFLDTSAGRDAYAAAKAGAVTGLSIGYIATEYTIDNGVRTILEAKLGEISVVTFPCNTLARVNDVKSIGDKMTNDEFLAKLTELGVDEDDAQSLLDKRNKADEVVEDEATDEADEFTDEAVDATDEDDATETDTDEDSADDNEHKYEVTAVKAVNKLIREMKQENHGR